MRKVVTFAKLSAQDRRLLFSALGSLILVRVGLWLVPFHRLVERLHRVRVAPAYQGWTRPPAAERVVWAVRTVSPVVPAGRTALLQSLAGQILLARRGYLTFVRTVPCPEGDATWPESVWVDWDGQPLFAPGPTQDSR